MNSNAVNEAAARERRDIEWLVNWALEKQGLGSSLVGGAGGSGGFIGVKVDGGGGGSYGRWTHDDALVIGEALNTMARDTRALASVALVVRFGRLGARPDWGAEGCGRWQLVRRNNGEGRAVRRYANQRKGTGLIGFEWEWVGLTAEDVERMMLEWVAWHACLADLRDAINSKMRHYLATGPAAPEAPWDEMQRSVTLPGGRVVGV